MLFAVFTLIFSVVAAHQYKIHNVKTPNLPKPALKELAKQHGVALGNHAIYTRIGEEPYSRILTEQHDFVLLDNTPNWHFTGYDLRPTRESYDFSQIDELVAYAKRHNMPMQAHHYLWGEKKWLPDWLINGDFSPEELDTIMRDHIYNVGKRYSGTIAEWTVVNEAFTRGENIYGLDDWWGIHTKSNHYEYIDKAFRWAREADPKSVLILNDFGNERQNNISDLMYNYVKGALQRGVPIDAIGMQMHIDGSNPPGKEEVIANMKRFAALGLKTYVTEFDVNMADAKGSYKEKAEIEKKIYYDMMRACIESKVCPSFAFLGITDKETWYNYMGLTQPMPLMFDEYYKPKPAYYGLRQALEEQ